MTEFFDAQTRRWGIETHHDGLIEGVRYTKRCVEEKDAHLAAVRAMMSIFLNGT